MRRFAPYALSLAILLALGCASTAPPAPPAAPISTARALPDRFDETLASPGELFARAEVARAAQQPELAYRLYALIHQLHPTSPEDREAFLWAARLGKRKAEVTLYPDRNSIWVGPERALMYQWFESIVQEKFSEEHARALLTDATYELARHFFAHAAKRPALARWEIGVEEDNGRVYAVHWVENGKRKGGAPAE
jgi:hypothetical protein